MLLKLFSYLRPKRRWLQFSLGSLLLLITVLGIWLSWQVNRVRREREAIALVERLGGGLPQLKSLIGLDQWFGLSGTAVTDAGLNDLKGFTNLKQLNLRHTKVTRAAARELKKSLPNTDVSQGP